MNGSVKMIRSQFLMRWGLFGFLLCLGTYLFNSDPALYLAFILSALGIVLAAIDPFYALGMLLMMLPLHVFMINLVKLHAAASPTSLLILGMWKEIVLAAGISIALIRVREKRSTPPSPGMLYSTLGLIALAIPFIFISPNIQTGLYGFRNLYEGVFIFLTVLYLSPSLNRVIRLADFCIAIAVVISIWGVLQVYVYGYQYLIDFGFANPSISIQTLRSASLEVYGVELQRANSIVVGPNELGLYLAVLSALILSLLLAPGAIGRARRKFYYVAIVIMLICEFHTFSRTAWFFTAITAVGLVSDLGWVKRKVGLIFTLLILSGSFVYLIPAVKEYILKTYNISDSSSIAHYYAYVESWKYLMLNPFGYGFGTASYKIGNIETAARMIYAESFSMLVALEMGFLGMLAFCGFPVLIVAAVRRGLKGFGQVHALWFAYGKWLVIATVISQLLSIIPLDLLFQSYFWFFLGVALISRPSFQGCGQGEPIGSIRSGSSGSKAIASI
jgi:hypothetical protein